MSAVKATPPCLTLQLLSQELSVSSLEAFFFFSDIYLLMCKGLRLGMHMGGVKGQVAGAAFPFRLAGPRDHTQVMRLGGKSP